MTSESFRYIGKGVYSITEASRLVRISRHKIRRWTQGYTYYTNKKAHYSAPVIGEDLGRAPDEVPVLSFLDLLEVRFLDAFLRHGVSWKTIRIASEAATKLLGRRHPFSTRKFKTDGRTILLEILREAEGKDKILLDLVSKQYVFEQIISPYLYEGIVFGDNGEPELWWPLGIDRSVVINPKRAFGAPITVPSGVPTKVLDNGFKAEGSVTFVAEWYNVTVGEVRDALDFEERLSA